ncbi:MAG: hypothetical protein ACAI37_09945 [Chthoniobacter sp.]
MRIHYSLYADSNCTFHLKAEGEDRLNRFADFLGALNFIHATRGEQAVDVTVYDALGKVALSHMLIESDDYLLFAEQ